MPAQRVRARNLLLLPLPLLLLLSTAALAQSAPAVHLSRFGEGEGPSQEGGVYRLLDRDRTPGQSNAVAFDAAFDGAFEEVTLRCKVRVLEGGDGGAFLFLNTAEFGRRGPAPFLKSWVEPNLRGTFAVGVDVHDPPVEKPSGVSANYEGLPEREVSLHWDGREIVKRVAPAEFRGDFAQCEISVRHVIGGAEVTVRLAGAAVYDAYFIPGMLPYESRLAVGAGTRADATTEFDVREVAFRKSGPAPRQRPPKHFELFNHVRTEGGAPLRTRVALPPRDWAFGRVILTLEIHDAGPNWDYWDRSGHLYVVDPQGVKRDIAPFITSFRTPGRWKVDVTHFRPWLSGEVTFELETATDDRNRGFLLSASADFYHGIPALEPYRVVPLWTGTARYGSAENHFRDFFTPQTLTFDAFTKAARLFLTTTGHSLVGEFTPSRRAVVFVSEKGRDPASERRFENVLWKSDSYLSAVRPQRGTWYYSRAGWAPGDVVHPWWIDLTPWLVPGNTAELRYEPEPYDFSDRPAEKRPKDEQVNEAIHLVRAYVILYRTPSPLTPAPALQLIEVQAESNAARAGLEPGDYLESYDGKRPGSIEDLLAAIDEAAADGKESVRVVIHRGSERLEKEVGSGRMGVRVAEE
ncbi:MAG: hypothetical protein HY900_38285 [Deltaproteobacteria bacterium]|nr:hypothetical protein [Deltaproteobacteria bacterium]